MSFTETVELAKPLVEVLSALLTPLIAVIATYIAWQQHVMNRRQLRLALFEKRMAVFNGVIKLISAVVRQARVEIDDLYGFLTDTYGYEFLFGKEVKTYVDELYEKAADVHARMANEEECLFWFCGQAEQARKVFAKYLSIPEP